MGLPVLRGLIKRQGAVLSQQRGSLLPAACPEQPDSPVPKPQAVFTVDVDKNFTSESALDSSLLPELP